MSASPKLPMSPKHDYGKIMWEHPRVEAATTELQNAAIHYALESEKDVQRTGFTPFMDASNRLFNAAIAFANTIAEYHQP